MARGATKTAENMAQDQVNLADANAQTAGNRATSAYNTLMPQIQSYLQPGGNPAVTAATMGALGSSLGAQKQTALDTETRTNNAASTNATLDSLARTQGTEAAQAAANNVTNQQMDADKLLSGLYGENLQGQNQALNTGVGGVNAYTNAAKTGGGVTNSILNGLLGAGKIAAQIATG